ncbi:MAG: SUMF1/EgtB/PvdO family nonheme iron enzyme [Sedimentisphaerales bacterium]|nr:SUMF1/EgtB/PvdO family nonheme iron enzyme [Sedimentisphaerales bacterium]
MKRFAVFFPVLLVVVWSGIAAASSAPVVSNVTVSHWTDGSKKVDIRYDLADADNDRCTVNVQVSSDGGLTWTVRVATFLPSSDIGSNISPGTGKLIVWYWAMDLRGGYGTNYKVKIMADDGHTPTAPDMVYMLAGTFQMGDHFFECAEDERPVHKVYLDLFYIGKYEVTNFEYSEFLNKAASQGLISINSDVVYKEGSGSSYPYCATYQADNHSRIYYDGNEFTIAPDKDNHPMVEVTWYGAVAYCNWRSEQEGYDSCYDLSTWTCDFNKKGYRLPTEAEWEYAARGRLNDARFPWGDTITHAQANYWSGDCGGSSDPNLCSSGDCGEYTFDVSPTRGYHPIYATGSMPYTAPVGSFAANGQGLYDMAGNVWEWCNDLYDGSYYSASPYSNPSGPTVGDGYNVRGGSWDQRGDACRVADRGSGYMPSWRYYNCGFRLVQDLDSASASWAYSGPFTIGDPNCSSVLYVDNDAPNDPEPDNPEISDELECGSQEHPFDAIQEAVSYAFDGDTIIVLPGVYSGSGNHDIYFSGNKIALRSTDPNDQNIVAETVIDCYVTPTINHYGFVFNSYEEAESVIDGLTIINVYGTAIYCPNASPTIRRCVFRNNKSGSVIGCGGSNAMILDCRIEYNTSTAISCGDSSPTISRCSITNNSVEPVILCSGRGSPLFHSCDISYNDCGSWRDVGWGNVFRFNQSGDSIPSPRLVNCSITNNWGRGIFMLKSSPTIENCTISGNYCSAIEGQNDYTDDPQYVSSNLRITNSLITCNHLASIRFSAHPFCGPVNVTILNSVVADNGYRGAIRFSSDGGERTLTIKNSIIFGNVDVEGFPQIFLLNTQGEVAYSNVQGGWPGEGNIDADPMFTRLGYWDPNGTPLDSMEHCYDDIWFEGDYHIVATSPCIDVGDNNSVPVDLSDLDNDGNTTEPIPYDLDGRPRIYDGDCNDTVIVDMGAYEFAHAYMGDFDCDDAVGFLDFAIFSLAWLTESDDPQWNPECDIAIPPDGYVDIRDLDVFVQNWLERFEPPTPARNPNPPDGATDVGFDADLGWTAGYYTASHDVYFGTDLNDVTDANNSLPVGTSPYKGNQVEATFDPGIMAPQTTYYWRIDEVNPYGTTNGSIWSFTTGPLPGPATDPDPPDGSVGIQPNLVLSWQPGAYATSHNVFFGNSDPPPFVIEQNNATFEPGPLSCDATYYWRIDEVNPYGTTTGSIWSFTLSGPASEPDPPDGAVGIQANPVLSWQPGLCATSHNIFFGSSDPPPFQTNQTETTFNPGALSERTTYYWRIEEVGEYVTNTGEVWTFTTGQLPALPTNPDPPAGTIDVGLNPILSWTAGAGAESHEIYYFGTFWDWRNYGNQTGTTFEPGTLSPATQYYWRIAEISRWGITYGPEWSFTTQGAK